MAVSNFIVLGASGGIGSETCQKVASRWVRSAACRQKRGTNLSASR